MKKILTATFIALTGIANNAFASDNELLGEEEFAFDRLYVSAGAMIVLPSGGSDMRRLGGGAMRMGYYLSEFWAAEAEIAALENHAGISGAFLWHWWGYERLDPFFTMGAKGWLANDNGQVGPKIGAGTFYHLTDSWSLRFDADVTLGLDCDTSTIYSLCAAVEYSF